MDIGRRPVQVSAAQADKRSLPNTRKLAIWFKALSPDIHRQADVGGYEEAEFTVQKDSMSFSTLTMFVSALFLLSVLAGCCSIYA
jgi:hypothetical protein